MSIEIWIPAHNEERVIVPTIEALKKAIAARSDISIGVACNGCTDKTVSLCQQQGVRLLDLPAIGKWKTLESVIRQAQAEWIFFIDAGTLLNPSLFSTSKDSVLDSWLLDRNLMGFTLQYASGKMNRIESFYWNIEAQLKALEEKLGGLIAVSGFAMCFRREALVESVNFLKNEFGEVQWLNDDVILPLSLRFLHPEKTIKLFKNSGQSSLSQGDLGLQIEGNEDRRRLRMMRGNLQWIRRMLPLFFQVRYFSSQRGVVLLILSRRVLKVFWAYLLFGGLFFMAFEISWFLFLTTSFVLLLISLTPRFGAKFRSALRASLSAPLELFSAESSTHEW